MANGFKIESAGSTVRGFVINRFSGSGILLNTSAATGNTVAGNWVGLNATGTAASANSNDGIQIANGASNNVIGGTGTYDRNVVSGNTAGAGISVATNTNNNIILGNYVGVNAAGSGAVPNAVGIVIANIAVNTLIGGTSGSAANVISGNSGDGILIADSGVTGTRVEGNRIGTNLAGTAALPNGGNGVTISNGAASNVIGGSTAGAGNVISGNAWVGVQILGIGSTANRVSGNFIGLNAAGTAAVPNLFDGVGITGGAEFNVIGTDGDGTGDAAERNVISGNGTLGAEDYNGIVVGSNNNLIAGNYLGTDATGSYAVPNSISGVAIIGASGTKIGVVGTFVGAASMGNLIAGNRVDGVYLSNDVNSTVSGNVFGLGADGVTAIPNKYDAVYLFGSSTATVGTNADGFGDALERNVIAATKEGGGIYLYNGLTIRIAGNYIGTDVSGALARGNDLGGIYATGTTDLVIGGLLPAQRNVISGNLADGIILSNVTTVSVVGNRIGTNAVGGAALGNVGAGVLVTDGSTAVTVGGSVVNAGNVISGNNADGILISGNTTTGNAIQGNFIGTNAAGTSALANTNGVQLLTTGGNTIGGTSAGAGNVISGNTTYGVWVSGGTITGNKIQGNFIGLNATSTAALGNATGVRVDNAPNTEVGGLTNSPGTEAGNVISGNTASGVSIVGVSAAGTVVAGNIIGLGADGTTTFAGSQFQYGVGTASAATGVTIGGMTSNARNIISGNGYGVRLIGPTSGGINVQGNFIGTNISGTAARGNTAVGILIEGGSSGNTVGGTAAGAGNVISGNQGTGVWITGSNSNTVYGNRIGTIADGTAGLGNTGVGVLVEAGSDNTFVGSSLMGAGNLISGNGDDGVRVSGSTTDNTNIIANRIGTNAAGTAAIGNQGAGVYVINAPGVQIGAGGETVGAGNVISGNVAAGIWVEGATATGTIILGNRVGTSADGLGAIANAGDGLDIRTSNNVIGGSDPNDRNVISGNTFNGIHIQGGTSGNVILGNYVGLNASGTNALGNGNYGIRQEANAEGTAIGGADAGEGNVISGNLYGGIYLNRAVAKAASVILGNYIGTDATGTEDRGNASNGIFLLGAAGGHTVGGGGPGIGLLGIDAFAGNLISGNSGDALFLDSADNTALGNRIGTDRTGTADLGNNGEGIRVQGANNTIGGIGAGEGNLVSGNGRRGVLLTGSNAVGTTIIGNLVGTNAAGTAAIANSEGGVFINNDAKDTVVGGTTVAHRNVISGNTEFGVKISGINTTGNTVAGNFIGTNAAGTAALANGGDGVLIDGGASSNLVGGSTYNSPPVSANLRGWFNADSGVTADGGGVVSGWNDLSGSGFNGTVQGSGITLVDSAINGHKAVRFTGAGGISLGSGQMLSSQQFTVIAVVTDTRSDGAFREVYSNWRNDNSVTSVFLGTRGQGPTRVRFSDAFDNVGTVSNPTTPFILTGLSTATDAFVFQNDTQIAARGSALPARNLTTGSWIGQQGNFGGNEYWHGDIVELLVYNQALSPTELASTWDYLEARYAIGGASPAGAGNLISGNTGAGVHITGTGTSDNSVAGNLIGTNAAGTAALPNADGVLLDGNSSGNLIGTDGDGANDAGERNVVSGNTGYGILMDGSNDNVIAGNYVGTNPAGTAALPNYIGVTTFYSTGNVIGTDGSNDAFNANERNVISGNTNRGVILEGANVLAGNYVGLNAAGTAAIGNEMGVQVTESGSRVGTNADGIADVEERNVISGNTLDGGVVVGGASTQNVVIAGNYIGTNAAGDAAIPNSRGVSVTSGAFNVRIGMNIEAVANAVEANLISGNTASGIFITDAATKAVTVAGNTIGLNADGTAKLGNVYGIHVNDGAHDNVIGGSAFAFRNVVSGNSSLGLLFTSAGSNANLVRGNFIGTNPAGTASLGNGTWGVIVLNGSANVFGGNLTAGEGNLISGNGQGGIAVFGSGAAGNVIRGNTIGLNLAGTAALANAYTGIYSGEGGGFSISGYTSSGVATGTIIGGGGSGQGNVSSGNLNYGIWINGTAASATIQGNRVGTNMLGTAAVGNTLPGVRLSSGAANVLVGTDGDGTNDVAEGNLISGNVSYGVEITGAGTNNNRVAGNLIGTDATGTGTLGNQYGVVVSLGAQSNVIGTDGVGSTAGNKAERNVISGNNATGIWVEELNTKFNRIAGNVIGLNAGQTAKLANNGFGILLRNGPSNNWIGTNGDGVGDADEGNVVAGNASHGILLTGPNGNVLTNNVVAGNYVGTTATGTTGLGNTKAGVWFDQNVINSWIGTNGDGSSDAIERNVVAGNQQTGGINVTGVNTDGNVIAGNFVGLAPNGVTTLGNVGIGIRLAPFSGFGPSDTRIGTNSDGQSDDLERNVVVGNTSHGVSVQNLVVNSLAVADGLIAGTFPRTTASSTIAQADLSDYTGIVPGDWSFNHPIPGADGDMYAFRATGTLQVNSAGTFTFAVAGNDGGRLRIDGVDVVVDSTTHSFARFFGNATLSAGAHTLEWVGFENIDVAGFELSVAVGGGKTAPITPANGWQVLGSTTPHAEINLAGSVTVTAYYPSAGIVIAGNYIGVRADGTASIANSGSGLFLDRSRGVQIGGSTGAARNVISGNAGEGVFVSGGSDNRIQGNSIGLNATGTAKLANGNHGIRLEQRALRTVVGTDGDGVNDATEGNVISGNTYDGVTFWTNGGTSNVIAGNLIGTDTTGK